MTFTVATFTVAFCLHCLLTDTARTSDISWLPLSFCQSMAVETTTVSAASAASAECMTVDGGTRPGKPGGSRTFVKMC